MTLPHSAPQFHTTVCWTTQDKGKNMFETTNFRDKQDVDGTPHMSRLIVEPDSSVSVSVEKSEYLQCGDEERLEIAYSDGRTPTSSTTTACTITTIPRSSN